MSSELCNVLFSVSFGVLKVRFTGKRAFFEILWYNLKIQVKKKTIFYRTWSEKGDNFISDLLL